MKANSALTAVRQEEVSGSYCDEFTQDFQYQMCDLSVVGCFSISWTYSWSGNTSTVLVFFTLMILVPAPP